MTWNLTHHLSQHGPAVEETPAIRATGLRRRFGSVQALDGLSLTVYPGEVVAFLGPNGAGKTTAIDIMLGLGRPDDGSVEIFGMTPREAVSRGLVSAVMQTAGLLPDITVEETVGLTASFFGRTAAVPGALERAGISDMAKQRVAKCSGGQQQRVRFAMALVSDPSLIILDEPTAGMDVAGRRAFWDAIRADAADGKTVVFATHYLEEAEDFADRIVLVRDGAVIADGSARQIKASVTGRIVKATLPTPDETVRSQVAALPGVRSARLTGHVLEVVATDTDSVARYLFTSTSAHDLDIFDRGLEDAFLELTSR